MHCDDKRTNYALKQFVLDATSELDDLVKQLKTEQNNTKKMKIQDKINYLQKAIEDSNDQLSSIN